MKEVFGRRLNSQDYRKRLPVWGEAVGTYECPIPDEEIEAAMSPGDPRDAAHPDSAVTSDDDPAQDAATRGTRGYATTHPGGRVALLRDRKTVERELDPGVWPLTRF